MLQLHGTVKDGKFVLTKAQYTLKQDFLRKNEGKAIVEILKKEVKKRSLSQLKAHFGLALQTIVEEFDDRGWDSSFIYNMEKPTGVPINKDMLQQYFYALYPTCNDKNELITLSHDDFDTVKEMTFFDAIRNHAASQWSIYIENPDPLWREKLKEQNNDQ